MRPLPTDAPRTLSMNANLRAALEAIPVGIRPGPGLSSVAGWSRYDTDDEHVLHVWVNDQKERGVSFDLRAPRAALAAPTPSLDVERLARAMGEHAERIGESYRCNPGCAEAIATEYAAQAATTGAGRALIAAWRHVSVPWMEEQIAAIEAEARAALLVELRAGVEGLSEVACRRWHEHTDQAPENLGVNRGAVLSILKDKGEPMRPMIPRTEAGAAE